MTDDQGGRPVRVRLASGEDLTLRCPPWCLGTHESGGYREDAFHDGREHVLTVRTVRGASEVLNAAISSWPHATDPARRAPTVVVLGCGELDPAGVLELADTVAAYAIRLRVLARELAEARAEYERTLP